MLRVECYLSEDAFSNSYLLIDTETDEAAVIDPSHLPSAFGTDPCRLKLKYVLLTHGHFDHFMKADRFLRQTQAELCIHAQDAELLPDGMKNCSSMFLPESVTLDVAPHILSDGDVLMLGDKSIRVCHTPGHTAGSVCYIAGDRLFSGDLLFRGSMGRTDFYSGNAPAIRDSLRRVATLPGDYTVYPGHGSTTALAYERKYNDYLRDAAEE